MLFFVACSAVAVSAWKAFVYEPPTHKIPLYEKALGTRSSARVGPNEIKIRLVARNDRDSSIYVENGHGKVLAGSPPKNEKTLADAAGWLDIAQIELDPGPDLLDIIQVRIFDHDTRKLISELNPAFGWSEAKPNLIHLYGVGKELPDTRCLAASSKLRRRRFDHVSDADCGFELLIGWRDANARGYPAWLLVLSVRPAANSAEPGRPRLDCHFMGRRLVRWRIPDCGRFEDRRKGALGRASLLKL